MEEILGILYPRRCPVCDGIAAPRGELICTGCRERLSYIAEPTCKRCGKEILRKEQEYCGDCARVRHSYTAGKALFAYDEVMKKSVGAFKYKGRQEYSEWYGREMARVYGDQIRRWGAEALIPVPIHKSRYRERGYNQAALLVRSLAKYTGLPADEEALVRIKKTTAQKTLSTKERAKNLQDAFQLSKSVVQYKRIILVDDIYTTGSTADACAGVLREGGVEQVYLLCLCIGSGF